MPQAKVRIGELLVEADVLTEAQLEEALELQRESGTRLGSVLIQKGLVTEPQLIQALSKQLSIPWVSLWHLDISEHLLDMIPEDIVLKHGVLPIYIRTLRGGDKALYIAMDNPADSDLLEEIGETCGISVKPMIAGPSEIASAILNYYGTPWKGAPEPVPEARISSVPPPAPPQQQEEEKILLEETVEGEEEEQVAGEPLELTETVDDEEEPEGQVTSEERDLFAPQEVEAPPPRPKKAKFSPGAINLTFLDGTAIAFRGKEATKESARQSANDMEGKIDSLVAHEEGSEKLALAVKGILKTLLRRGLLTDSELDDLLEGK